jgi:hypothetical protein
MWMKGVEVDVGVEDVDDDVEQVKWSVSCIEGYVFGLLLGYD